MSDPVEPPEPAYRVAWEKAVVEIVVPVEGTAHVSHERYEIPLSFLFPTEKEFRKKMAHIASQGG